MRKLYARPASSDQMENNLIPMINIIFLLLIFFMIAGHISRQAKPKNLELATAKSQHKIKPSNVKLSITKDGEYFKDDVITSLDEIEKFFEKNQKMTEVNVQADKQVVSGDLDVLLDVLRTFNVNNVALTVAKEKP
jgi:biopolymer transport protein ExbD